MIKCKLEVCIDSLESARNAINGGADELEVCSSLVEGGLTPTPGLLQEILKMKPIINVMIRCRGSYFTYTEEEMTTMLSDIDFYKKMGVNRFVFGALTEAQEIDKVNCARVIRQAHPLPVTFHRAYDLCKDPIQGIEDIIQLGFDRLLSSGLKPCATDKDAIILLKNLLEKYDSQIDIMPGAGINPDNAYIFSQAGFRLIHSSCKKLRILPELPLDFGTNEVYETDIEIVRKLKNSIKECK